MGGIYGLFRNAGSRPGAQGSGQPKPARQAAQRLAVPAGEAVAQRSQEVIAQSSRTKREADRAVEQISARAIRATPVAASARPWKELAVERREAVADLELDRRGIGRGDGRRRRPRSPCRSRPCVGHQPEREADPEQRRRCRLLSRGRPRWPIISTMVEAGPTIASIAARGDQDRRAAAGPPPPRAGRR